MFHFAAHYGSLDNTANVNIPALTDGILSIRNNHFTPGEPLQLRAAYALGDLLLRARNDSARVRALAPNYLPNLDPDAAVPRIPAVTDLFDNPFLCDSSEEIVWEVTNSGAGPTDTWLMNWLYDNFVPAPFGEIWTLRGTSTTTSVAATWTQIAMTWDFQLPRGRYAVVGAQFFGATQIAGRLILDGQYYRPGGLAHATEGTLGWRRQLNGGLGLWGTFDTVTLPRVEILNGGAVSAHTVNIQVIRVP